jgi:peptidoglycan biosynthesis protein MviN/MurJ (putative lipid II flippase)
VPIARAVALGGFEAHGGIPLVATSLVALGAGVLAETWFILGTYAFYAQQDVRTPVRSMLVRAAAVGAVAGCSVLVHGRAVLAILGAAITLGSIAGAVHVWVSLARRHGVRSPTSTVARGVAVAASAAVPAALAASWLGGIVPRTDAWQVLVAGVGGGGAIGCYLIVQHLLKAPELREIRDLRNPSVER